LGRTGLAVLAVVTEALGSVVGVGAWAMVRAKDPNKQQNSEAEQNFENGRKIGPRSALASEFKKSRAESVLKSTFCQLVSLATDVKARKPRILGEIPMGYEESERQPWTSRHPYENNVE